MSDDTQANTQAGAAFVPPQVTAAPVAKSKARAPRPSRAKPDAAGPGPDAVASALVDKGPGKEAVGKNDPMMEIVCITLHDTKEVPPNGQFVAVNGKQYLIPAGRKCRVPRFVVEALNNAVVGVPDINDALQVVGVRDAPRLPYTLHIGE